MYYCPECNVFMGATKDGVQKEFFKCPECGGAVEEVSGACGS